MKSRNHSYYLQRIQAGIDYIEANLESTLDIEEVAKVAAMSRWHFQRMFRAITGDTVKCYIRTRRLSNALEALLSTDQPIIDIALAAGFETQESFTRSFIANFAIAPGKFRELGETHKFMRRMRMDERYLEHLQRNISKTPELRTIPPKHYTGLQTDYYGVDSDKNNFADKLQTLWGDFMPRIDEIDTPISTIGYGVIEQTQHQSDLLQYLAAVEVFQTEKIPSGMMVRSLPETHYAIFEHYGDPLAMDDTVNYIYATWLPHSEYLHTEQADLEIYGPGYIPDSQESLVHYAIPVTKI